MDAADLVELERLVGRILDEVDAGRLDASSTEVGALVGVLEVVKGLQQSDV